MKDRLLGQGTPRQAAMSFAIALLLLVSAALANGILSLALLACGLVAGFAGGVLLGRRPIRR